MIPLEIRIIYQPTMFTTLVAFKHQSFIQGFYFDGFDEAKHLEQLKTLAITHMKNSRHNKKWWMKRRKKYLSKLKVEYNYGKTKRK